MRDFLHEIDDALRSGGYDFVVLPRNHWGRQFDLAHGINRETQPTKGLLISFACKHPGEGSERELWVELGRLVEAAENCGYATAYLVLCGEGWNLSDRELTEAMAEYLPPPELEILHLEEFVARLTTDQL